MSDTAPIAAVGPWWLGQRFRRWAAVAICLILAVEGWVAIVKRDNDFVFHRNLGLAFLDGRPYANGGDWYPVGRVMINAASAALPYRISRGVWFALAVLSLWGTFEIWHRLCTNESDERSGRPLSIAAGALAAAIGLGYLLRDLDECGLQTLLLFMVSAAAWFLTRGQRVGAGCLIGLAATYKLTPALFVPLLLWKRQWGAAGWAVVFMLAWSFVPALFVGWDAALAANRQWFDRMRSTVQANAGDVTQNGFEEPKHQNQALTAALARYLVTYPPGHPLTMDHPGFRQFGRLSPAAAGWVTKAILIGIGCIVAWRFRNAWASDKTPTNLAAEWAIATLGCAVLAPLCWKQHLVMALPCLFVVGRAWLGNERRTIATTVLLVVVGVLALASKRFVAGKELSILLMSYKVDTLAMLVLCGMSLAVRQAMPASTAGRTDEEFTKPPLARAA
jgi:hypothetical protein